MIESSRYEEFSASFVHLYVQQALANYPALKENANFRQYLQANVEKLVMQITTWCASGMIPTRIDYENIEVPDGAWQMFKRDHLPNWFKEAFPVRTNRRQIERTIHTYFVCPHLVTARQGDHVQFMATGTRVAPYFGSDR